MSFHSDSLNPSICFWIRCRKQVGLTDVLLRAIMEPAKYIESSLLQRLEKSLNDDMYGLDGSTRSSMVDCFQLILTQ